jgi:hypothetical protein
VALAPLTVGRRDEKGQRTHAHDSWHTGVETHCDESGDDPASTSFHASDRDASRLQCSVERTRAASP